MGEGKPVPKCTIEVHKECTTYRIYKARTQDPSYINYSLFFGCIIFGARGGHRVL